MYAFSSTILSLLPALRQKTRENERHLKCKTDICRLEETSCYKSVKFSQSSDDRDSLKVTGTLEAVFTLYMQLIMNGYK